MWKVSSAEAYVDDNTRACCGEYFSGDCAPFPMCASATDWKTLWTGTPGSSGDAATIFSPPLCPYAFRTDTIRVDLDTVAAAGWNNVRARCTRPAPPKTPPSPPQDHPRAASLTPARSLQYDAAKLFGSLEVPPGLVLPDATATPGEENKVGYVALAGVHGLDEFDYQVTDCLGYGPAATVAVTLATPSVPFSSAPYLSISAMATDAGSVNVSAALDAAPAAGTFSMHEQLAGSGAVSVTLAGAVGLSALSFGTASFAAIDAADLSTAPVSGPGATIAQADPAAILGARTFLI